MNTVTDSQVVARAIVAHLVTRIAAIPLNGAFLTLEPSDVSGAFLTATLTNVDGSTSSFVVSIATGRIS